MQVSSAAGGISSTRRAATDRIDAPAGPSGSSSDDGPSLVAAVHDVWVERDLTEERDPELIGEFRSSAGAEEVVVAAVLCRESGHVLDDTDDRHV